MEPFDSIDVRRAMNFAFPQEQIVKTVFQDLAGPLTACMPDLYPGYNDDYWEYGKQDLDLARELIKGAGHGDGFTTSLSYNAGDPVQEPMAIILLRKEVVTTLSRTPSEQ